MKLPVFLFLFVFLFLITDVSSFIINIPVLSNATINVNNSDYLQGYTPTTLRDWMQKGSADQVCFFNSSNAIAGSSGFLYNDTAKQLTLNRNAVSAGVPTVAGTIFRINCADNEVCRMGITSYGTPVALSGYSTRTSRGTGASPTATKAGDILGQFDNYGRSTSAWSLSPRTMIKSIAENDFNDTAQGAYLSFWVTANTTATLVPTERVRIADSVIIYENLNVTGNFNILGNVSIKRPYGMFSSTQNQTVAVANTAYPMTFNFTEDSYLVYKSSDNANFSFGQTGDYLIELSIIAQSTTPGDRVEIWVQKNGVNIPRSNTIYDFKSNAANAVISVPFIIDMNMTDKFRVMYAASGTGVKLIAITNTSYSPETPSCIMTISKISEITE